MPLDSILMSYALPSSKKMCSNKTIPEITYALLAQLDRAFVYGTKGQGFESLATHQNSRQSLVLDGLNFFIGGEDGRLLQAKSVKGERTL